MTRKWAILALKWGVGPFVVLVLAAKLGSLVADARRGKLFKATTALSQSDRRRVEAAPMQAVANATWALGNVPSVKKMVQSELNRLSDSEGTARARLLLEFGAVDTNPDGQAAVIAAACAADASICDNLKDAMLVEISKRLVAPGNTLPLFFITGHPPISGF